LLGLHSQPPWSPALWTPQLFCVGFCSEAAGFLTRLGQIDKEYHRSHRACSAGRNEAHCMGQKFFFSKPFIFYLSENYEFLLFSQ